MTDKPFASPASLGILAATLLLVLVTGVAAAAEELSEREIKKLDKQAGKALERAQGGQAIELYEQILEATSAGHERRRDALWVVAVSRLSSDPGDATARQYLAELDGEFPRHPHQLEAAALGMALASLDETREGAAEVQAQLEAQQAALEAERRKIEEARQKIAGQNEEAGDRAQQLEGQLRRVRAELTATKEELAKKEEALQRLLKLRSERGSGGS